MMFSCNMNIQMFLFIVRLTGSMAAGLMSTAAIANGGGVASMAAGGIIAAAQSIGATGALATSTYVGAAVGDAALAGHVASNR